MKKKYSSRRKFIKTSFLGLTAITFPNIIKSNENQDYDVVVIGAGAAGLAATEELIKAGKKVICLEASERIGGRAFTDNQIFGEPYDLGALWLDNGETNPFKKFGENNSNFNLYKERSEEMYNLYSGNKKITKEDNIWKVYDGIQGTIAKTRKDIAPIEVVPYQDNRWFDTMHMTIGAWEMGKDFSDYSCKDYNFDYEIRESDPWHCKEGFGYLVSEMFKTTPVKLNTKVKEIDWSGSGVKVTTDKGDIKAKTCLITVSNGVLSSGEIKFTPKLSIEKEESFHKISMGHYNRIAFKFKKLFKKTPKDKYLYYRIDSQNASSPKGVGITINPSDSKLCLCDPGGNFGKELFSDDGSTAIDFALNELKKIFGNKIEKDLINSHAVDWSNNNLYYGAWASAEPGAFKYREILRKSVGDRIFFAGEATGKDWGTVAGAYDSGKIQSLSIIKMI